MTFNQQIAQRFMNGGSGHNTHLVLLNHIENSFSEKKSKLKIYANDFQKLIGQKIIIRL